MSGRIRRLNDGQRLKIGREQGIEVLVDPGRVAEDGIPAGLRQLLRKQRRERRSIRTKAAIGMPDVIAEILVLERIDHGGVGIFRRARRVRPRIVEELTQEAGEIREVLGRHRAGLEDHQAAIVQEIAQGGTELVVERPPIEAKSRNDRAQRRLQLRDAHAGRHGGFRDEPHGVRCSRHGASAFLDGCSVLGQIRSNFAKLSGRGQAHAGLR